MASAWNSDLDFRFCETLFYLQSNLMPKFTTSLVLITNRFIDNTTPEQITFIQNEIKVRILFKKLASLAPGLVSRKRTVMLFLSQTTAAGKI